MAENKVGLEGVLKKAAFFEYPPHNFPPGVPRIVTDFRHVYYHWKGDIDLDWVLFNNPNDISDLAIYSFRYEKMDEIIKTNKERNKNFAFLTFDFVQPYATGKNAYEILQTKYPSPFWRGMHVSKS